MRPDGWFVLTGDSMIKKSLDNGIRIVLLENVDSLLANVHYTEYSTGATDLRHADLT